MKITHLRVNHFDWFFGMRSEPLQMSWLVEESTGRSLARSRVQIALDAQMQQLVFDSGWGELDPLSYAPDWTPAPRTAYYWTVSGVADDGDEGCSEAACFETGKKDEPWQAQWICSTLDEDTHYYAVKSFEAKDVVRARAYVAAHGSYELYLNGEKLGDEYLAPGYHCYDFRDMAYTYDLTPYLREQNCIGAMLSPAWYKGRFGLRGHSSRQYNQYGTTMDVLVEIRLTHADGSETVLGTDESWLCHASPVTMSTIYDGEDYDARLEIADWCAPGADRADWKSVKPAAHKVLRDFAPVVDRSNVPIRIVETRRGEIVVTPEGETILDFGQLITGWMELDVDAPEGTEIVVAVAEVLEHGNWYRQTLRSARAELHYISAGRPAHIRPHGTFFGFRYLKISGIATDPEKVTACVMHSDLPRTAWAETDHPLVNQLISNAYWGQRDNFFDVPTDCPQRDERLGWTGDTQVFSGTACFNQYTPAFYAKWLEDLACEQSRLDGAVPGYVPVARAKDEQGGDPMCSCGWGDASTVVPWNVWLHYGDRVQLARDYPSMRDYVDYLYRLDEANGAKRLWQTGGHTADWLGLDNYKNPRAPQGGTDQHYIASAYYAYSSQIVAEAAGILGYEEDAAWFGRLHNDICAAMTREYFTPNGRCVCDTQAAYLMALKFRIVPEYMRPRLTELLRAKLYEDRYHLQTGFLGTPLLCPTLSEVGLNDLAYTILLNEEYPGWLNEVKLGATTFWERWNSVMPDGTINRDGMSSMNHYAYGAIVEWIYRYACGFREGTAGWRRALLQPMPNSQLGRAHTRYESASGTWECGWEIQGEEIVYRVTVPFNCTAELRLIGQEPRQLSAGRYEYRLPLSAEICRRPKELPAPRGMFGPMERDYNLPIPRKPR